MADLFDPAQVRWSYRTEAADVLRTTALPIAPDRFALRLSAACPRRSAAWWTAAMAGQDFSVEDHLDTERFNAALWRGLGEGPEPAQRSGRDLRLDRPARLTRADLPGCA